MLHEKHKKCGYGKRGQTLKPCRVRVLNTDSGAGDLAVSGYILALWNAIRRYCECIAGSG